MISELRINNYKSLHDVTLDVGRFNVLIGENGCGKSNLLEAITFAAAAEADKLDNEFLASRGIRVTEPKLMRSAFENDNVEKEIKIHLKFKDSEIEEIYTLTNDNQPYSKWNRFVNEFFLNKLVERWVVIEDLFSNGLRIIETGKRLKYTADDGLELEHSKLPSMKNEVLKMTAIFFEHDEKTAEEYLNLAQHNEINKEYIKNFVIYSPENTALRNFSKEGQIEPLGINGEGLFKLLQVIKNKSSQKSFQQEEDLFKWFKVIRDKLFSQQEGTSTVIQNKSPEQWEEIHTCLQLFDWYDGFKIPRDSQSEDKITITDHYLTMDFDQRSANEGFLFVLFYIALMVSDDTPKIFAIDNIDTSLNPKLCTKIIKELIRLAKKYDKQVFVTTHNPAILDGIDLGDDEQRLFVVSRNKTGHTRFKRIGLEDKPKSSARSRISRLIDKDENLSSETKNYILNLFDNSEEPLKLSEAFLRGYLGGLPTGF
jgi:predicted ATPase